MRISDLKKSIKEMIVAELTFVDKNTKLEALDKAFKQRSEDENAKTELDKIMLQQQRDLEALTALDATEAQKYELKKYYADKISAYDKQKAKEKKELDKAVAMSSVNIAGQTAELLSMIFKKDSKAYKVLQVAQVSDQLLTLGQQSVDLYDLNSSKYFLFKLIKKDIKKIALLATITEELHQYQNDNSAVSISEFSKRLYDIIANDPVPFIYEKLGDRYNHILIDEFQDTSMLQWQNFMPLLEHAVSQGKKNLLVGDAKQSIYKFRGGEVGLISSLKSVNQEFIDRKLHDSPLDLERFDYLKSNRELKSLESNYRSAIEIVRFNNEFFDWISSNPTYTACSSLVLPTYGIDLYQEPKVAASKYSGLVDVMIYHKPLNENHVEMEANWMLDRILELIEKELAAGFQYKDIAILTRKNRQSKFLAIQLKERNIPVISSDSLLVHYAKVVGFIIAFMRLKSEPYDDFRLKELLFQYADLCHEELDLQTITVKQAKNTDYYQVAIRHFQNLGFIVHWDESHLVAWVYGLVSTFNITQYSSEIEYLFKLLDIVNEFVLTKSDDFNLFLSYYDSNKSSFSIASPEGDNAITISSIHRSKGLEYPVVISPFVSWTHQPKTEQLWFDLKPFDFDVLQLDENRSLNYYYGKVVSNELNNYDSLSRQKQDEFDSVFLDALNMLYVAKKLFKFQEEFEYKSTSKLRKQLKSIEISMNNKHPMANTDWIGQKLNSLKRDMNL
jgi:ATP-dependent exoDNAse (exonuclease V) beta subunit